MIHYQNALQLNPSIADAYCNIGAILQEQGEPDKAMVYFQSALRINPTLVHAYSNIGNIFKDRGQPNEAIDYLQKALQINSDFADAHFNLSHVLLSSGNFKEGWEQYEWRLKTKDFVGQDMKFPHPRWDGRPLKGKSQSGGRDSGFSDTDGESAKIFPSRPCELP